MQVKPIIFSLTELDEEEDGRDEPWIGSGDECGNNSICKLTRSNAYDGAVATMWSHQIYDESSAEPRSLHVTSEPVSNRKEVAIEDYENARCRALNISSTESISPGGLCVALRIDRYSQAESLPLSSSDITQNSYSVSDDKFHSNQSPFVEKEHTRYNTFFNNDTHSDNVEIFRSIAQSNIKKPIPSEHGKIIEQSRQLAGECMNATKMLNELEYQLASTSVETDRKAAQEAMEKRNKFIDELFDGLSFVDIQALSTAFQPIQSVQQAPITDSKPRSSYNRFMSKPENTTMNTYKNEVLARSHNSNTAEYICSPGSEQRIRDGKENSKFQITPILQEFYKGKIISSEEFEFFAKYIKRRGYELHIDGK